MTHGFKYNLIQRSISLVQRSAGAALCSETLDKQIMNYILYFSQKMKDVISIYSDLRESLSSENLEIISACSWFPMDSRCLTATFLEL